MKGRAVLHRHVRHLTHWDALEEEGEGAFSSARFVTTGQQAGTKDGGVGKTLTLDSLLCLWLDGEGASEVLLWMFSAHRSSQACRLTDSFQVLLEHCRLCACLHPHTSGQPPHQSLGLDV